MARNPGQALPITAVQVGMTALFAGLWASLDGFGMLGTFGGDNGAWLLEEGTRAHYAIPGLFTSGLFGGDDTLRTVALAAGWTGLITTAANRVGETTALGKVSSSEASVLLATEPLWAALFAALWIGDEFGPQDIVGGGLIVTACLLSSVKPETLRDIFGIEEPEEEVEEVLLDPAFAASAALMAETVDTSTLSPKDSDSFQ